MIYTYTALDSRGELTRGSMSADSEAAAIIRLRAQGLYPTQINQASAETTVPAETTSARRPQRRTISIPLPIITLPKITCRDMFMVSVGVLFTGALHILSLFL